MKNTKTGNLKNYITVAGISLAIISLAMLPILITYKGQLFYFGDYMTQQIPFIKECRRMMLSGKPFWSWNTFLGANFIGTYSFYIYGSPFFWPLLLIPERFVTYGLSVMFAVKHMTAAVTSYAYLKTRTEKNHLAIIGGLLYAFSGFTLDSVFYNHFLDVIALFPLIPLFTDKALDNKKSKYLLSVCVFLSSITNYYFIIGTSFFFLIYLFFRVKYSDGKYNFKDALRCVFWYAVGGMMSIFILLPSALSLFETNKAMNTFNSALIKTAGTIPQVFKLLKNIVLPSDGIVGSATGFTYAVHFSNAAFIPVFGAVLLFAIVRMKKSTEWDYRIVKFLFIASLIPGFNGIFSMFSNMNYTRWWYAFVLMEIAASVHLIEEYENQPQLAGAEYRKSTKAIIIISSITVLPLIIVNYIVEFIPFDYIFKLFPVIKPYVKGSGLFDGFSENDIRYLIVFVILSFVSYGVLFLLIKKNSLYKKPVISIIAVAFVCITLYGLYMTNESYTYFSSDERFVTENQYIQPVDQKADSTQYSSRISYGIKKNDHTPKDDAMKLDNYSMIINKPSVRTFNSFKSTATSEFARIAGYSIGSVPNTPILYSTPAIQCVLSVSELMDRDSDVSPAEYYVPMGYTYEYYVPDKNYNPTTKKDENNKRIQLMTKACILDSKTAEALKDVVKPLKDKNVDWKQACADNRKTACTDIEMNSAGFRAVSQGSKTRLVYFSVPHDNGWTAYINGKETEIYTLNGGLMGIVVPEGKAEIEFKFVPPGLKAGAVISIISALVFAGAIIADNVNIKKKEEI